MAMPLNPRKINVSILDRVPDKIKIEHDPFFPVEKLSTEPSYQRPPDLNRVGRLANTWKESLSHGLRVSFRKRKWYVIDGWHRTLAARKLGIETLDVYICYGLTYEQEAALYSALNRNRRSLSTLQAFNAAIEAKDPVAKAIVQIVKRHGFQLPRRAYTNGINMNCIGMIQRIYAQKNGPVLLDKTLDFISSVWDQSQTERCNRYLVSGISFLFNKNKMKYTLHMGALRKRLQKYTPVQLLAKIGAIREAGILTVPEQAAAEIMIQMYNYRRQPKGRIPSLLTNQRQWEDQ